MCPWVESHAPFFGRQLSGLPSRAGISPHKRYCSRLSTVRPPHPCGLICGATLLGRRPAPEQCTSSPLTSCFHDSG